MPVIDPTELMISWAFDDAQNDKFEPPPFEGGMQDMYLLAWEIMYESNRDNETNSL